MKKILTLALSALLLFSTLFTGVYAAETSENKQEAIKVENAEIIKKDGKDYLSIVIKNVNGSALNGIQCYAVTEDEKFVFAEATMASLSGYLVPYADIGDLDANASKTVLYELTSCENKKAEVTLLVGYLHEAGDTVVAGSAYEEAVFENVLNQKYEKIESYITNMFESCLRIMPEEFYSSQEWKNLIVLLSLPLKGYDIVKRCVLSARQKILS